MKRAIFFISAIIIISSFSSQLLALPNGTVARLGKGTIEAVTFSPDGTMLAVAGSIGVYLYDAKSLSEIYLFETNAWMYSVAFNFDGSLLASGGYDGSIILWDMKPYIQKPTTYPCDVNSDGIVNILDLVIVGKSFGKDVNNAKADVNKDGIVDVLDLNIVGQHLGEVYK
jgi:WD40 repeat protein